MLRPSTLIGHFLPLAALACSTAPPITQHPQPDAAQGMAEQNGVAALALARNVPNSEQIQAAVHQKSEEIRQCYILGTFKDSQLAGTVKVLFTIEETGKVVDTSDGGSNIADHQVVECVLGVFAQLSLGRGPYYPTQVEYPIRFGKS